MGILLAFFTAVLVRFLNPIFKLSDIVLLPDYVAVAGISVLYALLINFLFYRNKILKFQKPVWENRLLWIFVFFTFIFLFFVADWQAFQWNHYRKDIYSNINTYLISFASLLFMFVYKSFNQDTSLKKNIDVVILVTVILLPLYLGYLVIFNDFHRYNLNAQNFQNVLHAMTQPYFGKTIFLDLVSQYGGYPIFLKPILKITGVSLISVTSIFAFLMFISFLFSGLSLYNVLKNKALVLLGFFAYVYLHLFATSLWPYELFFPYWPIRILFPALLIFVSYFYFKNRSERLFYAITILLSLGVLWNVDVGLVSFLSFLLASSYEKFCEKDLLLARLKAFLLHALKCFIVLSSVLILISLYYKITYGYWANYGMLFAFHQNYITGHSSDGLSRLSMNGLWLLPAITYIVSLNYSAQGMLQKKHNTDSYIFLLSILGIGIYSYHAYQYAPQIAPRDCYPAYFIILLYLDRWGMMDNFKSFFSMSQTRDYFSRSKNFFLLILASFICFSSSSFIMDTRNPLIKDHVKIHEFYFQNPNSKKILWEIHGTTGEMSVTYIYMSDYIKDNTITPSWIDRKEKIQNFFYKYDISNEEKIIIFSMWDSYLYMKLNLKSPLSIANAYHIIPTNQKEEVVKYILDGGADWIILDTDPFLAHGFDGLNYWLSMPSIIESTYHKVDSVPVMDNYLNGWKKAELVIYQKK